MFIDIHSHVWRASTRLQSNRITAPELVKCYDTLEVERGAVLPLCGPECHEPQSNLDILDACAEFPDRLVPFCSVHPYAASNSPDADLSVLLRKYKDLGCKGVGEVTANIPFLDPRAQNLFSHVEAVGLPLTFHISTAVGVGYGLVDDPGLPQLEETLRRFPKLTILGHSQPFWSEIAKLDDPAQRGGYPTGAITEEGVLLRLFREYPNLCGDLCGHSGYNALSRDPEYAVKFLTEFQDRLFFGLDYCVPQTNQPLPGFLKNLRDEGSITDAVFQKIARENAARLFA